MPSEMNNPQLNNPQFLVMNAGSSTLKYAYYDANTLACIQQQKIELTAVSFEEAVQQILSQSHDLKAVGHRIVHGGRELTQATLMTPQVFATLHNFNAWAPLHQPYNLRVIEVIQQQYQHLPQVAHFDTAFHSHQPELNRLYALPRLLSESGLIRYGFHGLSYEYIASVLPQYTNLADHKVVVLHLGSGASACGLHQRRSIASTMGFSALEGLMMATRSGSIDPGLLIYLLQEKGYSRDTLQRLLYKESGLLGVSGVSGDVRALLSSSHPHAKQAINLFCASVVRAIGQLVAVLQGLDVLVFTGGIGENAQPIREQITAQVSWLNPEVLVIPTNEELVIAQAMQQVLG